MRAGIVDIIEASYELEGEIDAWMARVGQAVDAHLAHGLGLIAIRYRIAEGFRFEPLSMIPVNMPEDAVVAVQSATANLPPEYVASTFASKPCDAARSPDYPPEVCARTDAIFRNFFEPQGWNDVLTINGLDPTGSGLCLGVWLPKRQKVTPRMRQRWSRVAAHIAAAHRLRDRLSAREALNPDGAEAVLTAGGRVEHLRDAPGAAQWRPYLVEGVRALDRSRSKMRRADPDLALAERKALVAARWTLLDRFESDGKHYVLAQRNDPATVGFESLTARERQALGFAALGHPNKLTAYEMGIAASTVSVLLHRAAKKLGTSSRAELLEAYRRLRRG